MKFIFWQNILSIHQSAFLKALAEKHHVTLVAEQSLEKDRKSQGWCIPEMGNVKIVITPEIKQIYSLLENNAIHIFSGINAYPLVSKAFNLAVKKNLRIGVMLEPFEWSGYKGKLRWIKYLFLQHHYKLSINFILTTGSKGYLQYKSIGFREKDIFEWGYFIDSKNLLSQLSTKNKQTTKPSVLFVGRIDKNKNIDLLAKLINKHKNLIEKFTIIGDGPNNNRLQSYIEVLGYIDYKGILPNVEVQNIMNKHDLLILPSQYDGWGAVINEALHSGIQVIASENCGASVLLDGEMRGEKFYFNGKNDLETVLLKWLKKGPVSPMRRQEIKAWSSSHISGEAAAVYFTNIVDYVYGVETTKPIAPWIEIL